MPINGIVITQNLEEKQVLAPDVHDCVIFGRTVRGTLGVIQAGVVLAEDTDGNLAPYEPGLATVADHAVSTAYVLGDLVVPATPDGFYYVATTAGTSDGTAPTFPGVEGETVTDGTVVWTCAGKIGTDTLAGGGVNVEICDTSEDTVARVVEHGGVVFQSLLIGYMGTAATDADVKALKAIGIFPA